MNRTAGLVLAAGAGRRYGGPKAVASFDGERLVDRAVRVLADGGCQPIVVVLGAWVGPVPAATTVVNPDWVSGMASSLGCGLAAVSQLANCDRVLVSLVDLPGLTPAAVARVLATPGDLVAASYHGVRGHPVTFARSHWAAVAASSVGDRGARNYLDQQPVTMVEVGDVATPEDMDTAPA